MTTQLFYVNSQEALDVLRQHVPVVEEFDTMMISIGELTHEELEDIRCDTTLFRYTCNNLLLRNVKKLRSAYIMVPDCKDSKEILAAVTAGQIASNRKIGDGAMSCPRALKFLPDQIWLCGGTDVNAWFAIRDKDGTSLTPGTFLSRIAKQ